VGVWEEGQGGEQESKSGERVEGRAGEVNGHVGGGAGAAGKAGSQWQEGKEEKWVGVWEGPWWARRLAELWARWGVDECVSSCRRPDGDLAPCE